jgi:hypothetical protein
MGALICSYIMLSTLRARLGGLDAGEKHERKRREKEKEDVLFKFGRLAYRRTVEGV